MPPEALRLRGGQGFWFWSLRWGGTSGGGDPRSWKRAEAWASGCHGAWGPGPSWPGCQASSLRAWLQAELAVSFVVLMVWWS